MTRAILVGVVEENIRVMVKYSLIETIFQNLNNGMICNVERFESDKLEYFY